MAAFDLASLTASLGIPSWLLVILLIWTLIWKGIALWKSARKNHLVWFVLLLIINTFGILEILYIFVFSKLGGKKAEKIKKKKSR